MMNNKEAATNSYFLPLRPPNKRSDISPYKISVIFLLQQYLKLRSNLPSSQTDDDDELADTTKIEFSPEYRRNFCMLILKLIQYPDLSCKDLLKLLSSEKCFTENVLYERFNRTMLMINERGVEVIFRLVRLMNDLITEQNSGISQHSVIGLYFRRVLVTLDKLSFQELMKLYDNLVTYYDKGIRAMKLGPTTSATAMRDIEDSLYNKQEQWSVKQAELFIAQQSAYLENDETKALKPKDMQDHLNEIIEVHNSLYSQAYFLAYMNSLRIRDLPNALEALHSSFDRMTIKNGQNGNQDNSSKCNFQYSILNLAILHTQFDHKEEALKCLKECIMTAQENGDRVCLQLAQLWLCLLDKSNFQLSEKNISNKTEMSLVHSLSLNIQSLVKVAAVSGYLPAKLFDVLVKSDILNCQHSMMSLISNCIAERSALWTLYGKNEIASLCSQLLLNSNLKSFDKAHNGEGLCQSMCSIAMWLSLQGDYSSSSSILQHAKEKFPRYPISANWILTEYYIMSQQSIHCEKWTDASNACDQLYHYDRNLSLLQRANLNISKGKSAQSVLELIIKNNIDSLEPLIQVRVMILQAQSLINHNYVPAETLIILHKASILAKDNYLDYENSIIEMCISYVLLKMGMSQQALKLIKQNMDNILANGGIYDKAKTLFLFVQCLIASSCSINDKKDKLEKTFCQLELAIEYFTKLKCYSKVKNIYIFMAKLYNELKMTEERNRYALKFRILAEEFTNNTNYNLHIFH